MEGLRNQLRKERPHNFPSQRYVHSSLIPANVGSVLISPYAIEAACLRGRFRIRCLRLSLIVWQICKKSFKRPQDLKKHEKIHTEEHHAQHKHSKAITVVDPGYVSRVRKEPDARSDKDKLGSNIRAPTPRSDTHSSASPESKRRLLRYIWLLTLFQVLFQLLLRSCLQLIIIYIAHLCVTIFLVIVVKFLLGSFALTPMQFTYLLAQSALMTTITTWTIFSVI